LGELFVLSKDKFRLLPVLYEISIEEMSLINPELVTVYCLSFESGLEDVVQKVLKKVKPKPYAYYAMAKLIEQIKKKWSLFVFSVIGIALFLIAFFAYLSIKPSDKAIETSIELRANALQRYVQNRQTQNIIQFNGEVVTLNHINQLMRNQFTNKKIIHHKNKVQYYNGTETLTSLDALIEARLFDAGSKVEAPFGLLDYQAFIYKSKEKIDWDVLSYSFYNLNPVHFKVVNTKLSFSGKYEIEVEYSNPIRYVEVNINIDSDSQSRQKNIQLFGFKKREKMVFEKRDNRWHILSIL
jgi:hypothetical protein